MFSVSQSVGQLVSDGQSVSQSISQSVVANQSVSYTGVKSLKKLVLRRWGHNRLVWFSWSVGLSGFRSVSQSVGQLASVSRSVGVSQ